MVKSGSHTASHRQLRVAETLRVALAEIFMHGETHVPVLDSASITVSEVRISPDLKNATVFFMPLNGAEKEAIIQALKEHAGHIRKLMNEKIVLRYSPKLYFKLDTSFEEASRVHQLLLHEKVQQDVRHVDGDED